LQGIPNYVAKNAILWVLKIVQLERVKKIFVQRAQQKIKFSRKEIEQSTYSPHYFL
jgi:hypothetical protein